MAIGKTRQTGKIPVLEERFDAGLERGRGLLRWPPPVGLGRHVRLRPPVDLAMWIESFWMVTWELDQPYLQETLPHPNFFFTFENRRCEVSGVNTGKFSRVLEGCSGVFGIRFRSGGFRPFLKQPASSLTGRTVPAAQIFGAAGVAELESRLDSESWDEDRMLATLSDFMRRHAPAADADVDLAADLVQRIRRENNIKSVADLAGLSGFSPRALQRIFREYVGATPKWVIRRFRLHELVEVLNAGRRPDWAQVALDLGYFDQAHLINDFKAIVGQPPDQYHRET